MGVCQLNNRMPLLVEVEELDNAKAGLVLSVSGQVDLVDVAHSA